MCIGSDADFFISGSKLKYVTRFKYRSSYVASDCSMKEELIAHDKRAAMDFSMIIFAQTPS